MRYVEMRVDVGPEHWTPRTFLLRLLINASGLFVASRIVPGVQIADWQSLVAGTAIFAIANTLLRPVALFASCCLIVVTFGAFVLVVNAAMLALTAWVAGQLQLRMSVDGFWSALGGALVISLISFIAARITTSARRSPR